MTITHRQRSALQTLCRRHDAYPDRLSFGTAVLGAGTASLLRKLAAFGMVTMTKGGPGSRQFFAITDSGRATISPVTE